MLKPILAVILSFLFVIPGITQTEGDQLQDIDSEYSHFFRMNFQYGRVLPTNEFLRGEYESGVPVKNFQALSLEFGWKTMGGKVWHHLYGNPSWGFGIYHAGFSRPEDLGSPIAIYGFYSGPFKRWNRFSINYDMQIGVSFNWQPFHETDNVYQISLGDDKAAYINLGVHFIYELSKYFDVDAGFSFTHFSNGSTVKPNKGINLAAPSLGIHYHLKGERPIKKSIEIPKYQDTWEWTFALTYGGKQVAFDTTNAPREIDRRYIWENYSVIGFSSSLLRQFTHKSKAGLGIDFIYDESLNAEIDTENNRVVESGTSISDRMALGVYGTYELAANRLSFYVRGGTYVLKKEKGNSIPAFYQQIGIKYHIIPNLFAGVSIRAYNFHVADYIEWTLGYRMKW